MNNIFSFLAIAIAMTIGSCLAQENLIQENPDYSSIPNVFQESTASEGAIQPYEITINLRKQHKLLLPTILLKKEQELIVSVKHISWATSDSECALLLQPEWGGWNNWWNNTPILKQEWALNTLDSVVSSYHFKAINTGATKIHFVFSTKNWDGSSNDQANHSQPPLDIIVQ